MKNLRTRFDGRAKNSSAEWLTPPTLLRALGEFDLDPCAPVKRPWDMAREHYTVEDDGLLREWGSAKRVWLNPPYGNKTDRWLRLMARHGNGLALVFARTETRMFFESVWNAADALYFVKGRISFFNGDGTLGAYSGGAPSVVIAYGAANAKVLESDALRRAGYDGKFVKVK